MTTRSKVLQSFAKQDKPTAVANQTIALSLQ